MTKRTPLFSVLSSLLLASASAFGPARAWSQESELKAAFDQLKPSFEAYRAVARASQKASLVPVVIYHTNDIHGHIMATPADPSKGIPASGGAASLATLLKSEKRAHLWLDSGDWFQGTPEGNLSKGDAMIAVFNALHLDAAAIGNHDFDYGADNLARLSAEANFPMLGSNISIQLTDQQVQAYNDVFRSLKVLFGVQLDAARLNGMAPAFTARPIVREVAPGIKVGVFGLLTTGMPGLEFPENIQSLGFGREVDAAQASVAELRSRGAGVVIALTHVGIEEDHGKKLGIAEGDEFIAKTVPGIDLILGGHTHTRLSPAVAVPSGGGTTLITQTQGSLQSVYQVVLHVNARTGKVERLESRLIDLDPSVYPPDPGIQKLVAGFTAKVQAQMDVPVGNSAAAAALKPDAAGESAAGDYVADVLRRYGKTDLGLVNTFGVRADIPAGPLTYGDLYKVMPFDNKVMKVSVRGTELRKLAEGALGDTVFLQFSGAEIVYDPKAPAGQRLKSMKVGGVPVKYDQVYTITTLDFLVRAGRDFKTIDKQILEAPSVLVRDLLVQDVKSRGTISASTDGRLKTDAP